MIHTELELCDGVEMCFSISQDSHHIYSVIWNVTQNFLRFSWQFKLCKITCTHIQQHDDISLLLKWTFIHISCTDERRRLSAVVRGWKQKSKRIFGEKIHLSNVAFKSWSFKLFHVGMRCEGNKRVTLKRKELRVCELGRKLMSCYESGDEFDVLYNLMVEVFHSFII